MQTLLCGDTQQFIDTKPHGKSMRHVQNQTTPAFSLFPQIVAGFWFIQRLPHPIACPI
jgi:hypothetical protein